MGLSSNQARFLSLTSRQVDLEHRIQQICQRRLRLTSELENVATSYNNSISNRKMYTQSLAGMQQISVSNLSAIGYKVIGLNTDKVIDRPAINPAGKVVINSEAEFLNYVSQMNSGDATALSANYVLNCDIDMSGYNTNGKSLIDGVFTGVFDGNGHTVSNLSINTGGAAINNIGMFSSLSGGQVSNITLVDCNISATGSTRVGSIAGDVISGGTIDNCYASGSIATASNAGGIAGYSNGTISNCTADVDVTASNGGLIGGIIGNNSVGSVVKNCVAMGDIKDTTSSGTYYDVGGLAGGNFSGHIENSSASGNIVITSNNIQNASGFVGTNNAGTIINCMSTGDVSGFTNTAGFSSNVFGTGAAITYSYTAGNITGSAGSTYGFNRGAVTGNTNFYQNNAPTDGGGADIGVETTGWDTNIWDLSGSLPQLKNTGYTAFADSLDEGLRNGTYSLAREADEFSQDPLDINGKQYEEIDWRSTPEIFDELYKGDDVEAENKYDKTVDEINSQDKKLQLEQTTIEVEYKAISSERESVKKILDTNAQSSFKYFS